MAAPGEAREGVVDAGDAGDAAASRPRKALGAGGLLLLAGLAMVGIGPSDAGTAVALAGFASLIYGIHTFGRLGPDAG